MSRPVSHVNTRFLFAVASVFLGLLAAGPTLAQTTEDINAPASRDVTGNGAQDVLVATCNDCGSNQVRLEMFDANAEQAQACYYCSFASVGCDDVTGLSYSSNYPTGGYLWSTNAVMAIKQGTTFGKVQINSYGFRTVNMTWETLSCSTDPPPDSSFTFTTYDWLAFFTDTSTGTPTMWSWDFGDSNSSTAQSPPHFYSSAGTRTVTLTAENAGGADPTPASQSVTVSTRPSTILTAGQTIDFDGDTVDDLQAVNISGCSNGGLVWRVLNGAQWGSASEDYRTVNADDISDHSITGTSDFCTEEGLSGLSNTRFVQTSGPSVIKFWSPVMDGSGNRIEWEVLTSDLPDPPVSSFTFTTFDLISFFQDTSTGGPTSWFWDLGDGNTSSGATPSHFYQSAGDYDVELTASNAGGPGNTAQQTVSVSQNPSLTMGAGGAVDLDGDGTDDLAAISQVGCSGDLVLRPINGATWTGVSEDYRTVDASDIPPMIGGTSDFCPQDEVDGLFDTHLLQNSVGDVMKFWTPVLSPSQVRLQSAILLELCSSPISLALSGLNVSGVESYEACVSIDVTETTVMDGGTLNLNAGEVVTLGNNFVVETNGNATIGTEPPE